MLDQLGERTLYLEVVKTAYTTGFFGSLEFIKYTSSIIEEKNNSLKTNRVSVA